MVAQSSSPSSEVWGITWDPRSLIQTRQRNKTLQKDCYSVSLFNHGKEKNTLCLLFCLVVLHTGLSPACNKENRSSSRCSDMILRQKTFMLSRILPHRCVERPELINVAYKALSLLVNNRSLRFPKTQNSWSLPPGASSQWLFCLREDVSQGNSKELLKYLHCV